MGGLVTAVSNGMSDIKQASSLHDEKTIVDRCAHGPRNFSNEGVIILNHRCMREFSLLLWGFECSKSAPGLLHGAKVRMMVLMYQAQDTVASKARPVTERF